MSKRHDDDRLKWGEGSIREQPRADGTLAFIARWTDEGPDGLPRARSKSFPSRDAAEAHLRETRRARLDGRYRSASDLTVSRLVADYIERAHAAERITARTMLTYRHRAAKMIDPTIGKKRLDQIAPLDVQRWIDGLSRQKFAPSTVHAAVAVLMGALREAAMLGVTDRHLGQGVRRPSIGPQTSATWTVEQVRAVLADVRDDPIFGALYHVAIATGLRPGELRALHWDDVNLDTGVVTVRRTITKDASGAEVIAMRTKSKRARAVAISPAVVERLKRHRTLQKARRLASEDWANLGLVFDRGDGHWLYASGWQRFHDDLCARVGVPRIRHHDLRHTSASLELEAGTHPRIVSERLGHSTVTMTLDRYSHVSASLQRAAANALSDRLFDDEDGTRIGTKM